MNSAMKYLLLPICIVAGAIAGDRRLMGTCHATIVIGGGSRSAVTTVFDGLP